MVLPFPFALIFLLKYLFLGLFRVPIFYIINAIPIPLFLL